MSLSSYAEKTYVYPQKTALYKAIFSDKYPKYNNIPTIFDMARKTYTKIRTKNKMDLTVLDVLASFSDSD